MTAPPRPLRVAVVGAGFGGVGMAARLLQEAAGGLPVTVTVLERGPDVGGVWRENAYPGAACDVPSHLYSFSFAPKPDWSRRFAPQPEIADYLREVAERFGVRARTRFGVEVTEARYDETSATWVLALGDGGTLEADVLVAACGQLSRPAYPPLPGRETFAGQAFHTATWPRDAALAGRRIAVVGTGASAIQVVPAVVDEVASLTLFQRHPPYVIRKPDRAYPPALQRAFARVPGLLRASRWANYWWNETRSLGFNTEPRLLAPFEWAFRARLRRQVADPALREVLTPRERIGCKRILISNDYYDALQRPHARVVTAPVAAVEPAGLRTADGELHEVDTVVWGTGFRATDFLVPMQVAGRGGRRLADVWADGAQAHLGLTVPGFPNLFLLYGPNTNLGHNSIVVMLEGQIGYVVSAVRRLARGDVRAVEVRPEVFAGFRRWVQQRSAGTVFATGCSSWYRTAAGVFTNNWPASTLTYRWRTRRFRDAEHVLEPAAQRTGVAA